MTMFPYYPRLFTYITICGMLFFCEHSIAKPTENMGSIEVPSGLSDLSGAKEHFKAKDRLLKHTFIPGDDQHRLSAASRAAAMLATPFIFSAGFIGGAFTLEYGTRLARPLLSKMFLPRPATAESEYDTFLFVEDLSVGIMALGGLVAGLTTAFLYKGGLETLDRPSLPAEL